MSYANYVHVQCACNLYTCVAWLCKPLYACAELLLKVDTPAILSLSRHISSRQVCAPLLSLPPLLQGVLLYILWSILISGNTSHDGLAVVVRNLYSQLLQVQFRNLLEEKYLATFTQSSLKYSAIISHTTSLWR